MSASGEPAESDVGPHGESVGGYSAVVCCGVDAVDSHQAKALLRDLSTEKARHARDMLLCEIHEMLERIDTQMKHTDYLETVGELTDGAMLEELPGL